jgi:hypothetical protein
MTKKTKKLEAAPRSIRKAFPQVQYVVDADKPMIVRVRKTDCDHAVPLDPSECALAKAAKREFHADAAVIGLSTSYVIKGNTAIRFESGERVAREIVSFDRHSDFAPGTYQLSPKSPTQKFAAQAEYARKYYRNRNKDKRENHEPVRKVHHTAKVRDLTTGVRGEEND